MYDDFATIKLEEFEKVAKEYNKMLKVDAYAVDIDNENSSQLTKNLEESVLNIKKLYNISRNRQNREQIKKLVDVFNTLSLKVEPNNQTNSAGGFATMFGLFNKTNNCYVLQQCLTSVAKCVSFANNLQDKQKLLDVHNALVELIANCKYL